MAYKILNGGTVVEMGPNQMALKVIGTTVPADTTAGYHKGCFFIDNDVAAGTSNTYVNVGTDASCNFDLITDAA